MIILLFSDLLLTPLRCWSCSWQIDTLTFASRREKFFCELFEALLVWFGEVDFKGFFLLLLVFLLGIAGACFGWYKHDMNSMNKKK